jgi:hypothetical protein
MKTTLKWVGPLFILTISPSGIVYSASPITSPGPTTTIRCEYQGQAFSIDLPEPGPSGEGCEDQPIYLSMTQGDHKARVQTSCFENLRPRPPQAGDPDSVCRETLAVPLDESHVVVFFAAESPAELVYDVRHSKASRMEYLAMAAVQIEYHPGSLSILTEDLAANSRLQVWRNYRIENGRLASTIDRVRTWQSFPIKGIFQSQRLFETAFGFDRRLNTRDGDSGGDYKEYNYIITNSQDSRRCVTPDLYSHKTYCQ